MSPERQKWSTGARVFLGGVATAAWGDPRLPGEGESLQAEGGQASTCGGVHAAGLSFTKNAGSSGPFPPLGGHKPLGRRWLAGAILGVSRRGHGASAYYAFRCQMLSYGPANQKSKPSSRKKACLYAGAAGPLKFDQSSTKPCKPSRRSRHFEDNP
jgi:hypothetical protein